MTQSTKTVRDALSVALWVNLVTCGGSVFAQAPPIQAVSLAAPPNSPAEQRIRDLRSIAFNRYGNGEAVDSEDARYGGTVVSATPRALPEFPASFADTIAVGTISSVQAYLSQNHMCLYSEYTVQVSKVVDQAGSVIHSNVVVIDQLGGAILLPGGRVIKDQVKGGFGRAVRIRGEYLFFLTYDAQTDSYRIVKLWELSDGRARAMADDDQARVAHHASQYDGMDRGTFLSVASGLRATYKIQ